MKKTTLQANARTVTGRKVKHLRADGLVPATLYGQGIESMAIQLNGDVFDSAYDKAGETGVVEIDVEGKKYPTLIHMVQLHPVTSQVLHVEFLQVNLKESIQTPVPVVFVGESPATKSGVGVFLENTTTVEVEALPMDLPEHLEADVSGLAEIGDEITVASLKAPSGVTILTETDVVLARISEITEEPVEDVAAEEPEEGKEAVEGVEQTETSEPAGSDNQDGQEDAAE